MGKRVKAITVYPVGGSSSSIKSYSLTYVTGLTMDDLRKHYMQSKLIDKVAREAFNQNNSLQLDTMVKWMRGQTLVQASSEYSKTPIGYENIDQVTGYLKIIQLAEDVDYKLNTVEFLKRQIIKDLRQIKRKDLQNMDLGKLHWKLIVDIESALFYCRSVLDLFSLLTHLLYRQICGVDLPKKFTPQKELHKSVKASDKKKLSIDTGYFTQLSTLSWFTKLNECRNNFTHETSLKIVARPPFQFYLTTINNTDITFADIEEIISGVDDFARYYVGHFTSVLKSF